jgi:hypothetical protein
MAERTIGLYPDRRFKFLTDYQYRVPWKFVLHSDAVRIIGQQLTYLAFHEWLMDNLRHTDKPAPNTGDWSELVFHVAEGFFKTDVLLYASICEAALYSVLHWFYLEEGPSAHKDLKLCFEKAEQKHHPLHKSPIKTSIGTTPRTGTLALIWEHAKPLADSEIQFVSLIAAGESVGIYNTPLRKRLDSLRDDRNAIHLAHQIKRNNKRSGFSASDRKRAKKLTEELRIALKAFVRDHRSI